MSYPIWHNCLRLSSVIFPVSSVGLFFAPRGTDQTAILAVTAVASAGVWAFCSGHRQSPPTDTSEDENAAAQAAGGGVADDAIAPRAKRLELACEEDDLVGFDFALGDSVYRAAARSPRQDGVAAAHRSTDKLTRTADNAIESRHD